MNKRFLRFCFLDDLLKLKFFTRCLYFHYNRWKDRGKKSIKSIFEGFYLNVRENVEKS